MNSVLQQKGIPAVMARANASGLLDSLCTIQRPDGVLIDAGQPSGVFVDIAGLINIPCMAPPEATRKITANEVKSEDDIQVFSELHVLLNAWYPQVEAGVVNGWRIIVDGGPPLDIMGAESDSQHTQTRLIVRYSGL